MSQIRRSLLLIASSALVLALAAPAGAGPGVGLAEGDAAADFEGKEFVNSEPVSLKALRGRIVLIELFSTG